MATIFAFILFLGSLWWLTKSILLKRSSQKKKKTAPEAGGSWPVIGHLHLLGGPKPPHIVLADMADKYGPIFTIRMGVHRTLVVSNWDTAKECLTTNDRAFANRPNTLSMELLGYDRSMLGSSPYGPYWRQVRKIATLELLSSHRLEMFKGVRESEVRTSMKELYKLWDKNKGGSNKVLVEMKRWFGDITLNIIFRIIVGKSVGYVTTGGGQDEGWKQGLRDFFDLSGRFPVADALPFLRWLDVGGHEKAMKRTAEELDRVVVEWLKEHKEKRDARKGAKGEEDFMDVMLNVLDDSEFVSAGRDSDTINKATCLGLILAASDTTAITSTWALSLLVNHPHVLKKTQQELDTLIGKERQVQESDTKSLAYLNAIIKETLRLYPAGPLSLPHESMEDCNIGDYHIPAGTRLLTNIWKIQRDQRVWSDPCEFQPERFLTSHKDVDFRGQNFEFIPFSGGRRMCPGINFALLVLQLTLASLLQGFDFETLSAGPVDMRESIGLTNLRATPLEVLLAPRLPAHLYE